MGARRACGCGESVFARRERARAAPLRVPRAHGRMSMQSPVSVQLAPDSASTMVNCTIKSEEKKEPCHEAPQGAAPAVETQPGDPALASQDATNAKAPPQDCASPESSGSPEPKRPAASEAASGSQERLDFNRNLQEVVPAIEKLLSSDWKERFLGRSNVEAKDVKGTQESLAEKELQLLVMIHQLSALRDQLLTAHSEQKNMSLSHHTRYSASQFPRSHF